MLAASHPDLAGQLAARRGWLLAVALTAAGAAALLFSSQIYVSMLDHGHDWWRLFLWQFTCWGFWGFAAPWVLIAGAGLVRAGDRVKWWVARLAVMGLVLVAGQLVSGTLGLLLLQPYEPVAAYSVGQSFSRIFDAWALVDPLIFAILVTLGYGAGGYLQARHTALLESRLEAQQAQAELAALRLEIQPHFLFNTLNSIAVLIRRGDNSEALDMLLGLSDLLRATIDGPNGALVPLREELDFTRRYLELHRIRFADRLELGFDVPEELMERRVPFLLLQPLAENAIRHGIGRQAGGGRVEVRARAHGGDLELSVRDDGVGLPEGFDLGQSTGVGLGNTISRLETIYGETAALALERRAAGGTAATIRLPRVSSSPGERPR